MLVCGYVDSAVETVSALPTMAQIIVRHRDSSGSGHGSCIGYGRCGGIDREWWSLKSESKSCS